MSPAFQRAFLARSGSGAVLSFAEFMAIALYEPAIGYYRRDARRIGYGPGTDFFTASTSGPIFGELIAAAVVTLLGDRSPADFTFVEIGAESPAGVLAEVAHPFGATRTVRVGDTALLRGQCIVFSNELFDAQPFRRFVVRDGRWRESGVHLHDGTLDYCELTSAVPEVLPDAAPEGYVVDLPEAAAALAASIAAQPWTGLFVACDYGKTWREIAEHTPAGTGRAYFRHAQSNDLLAQPGEQDLTCHISWDAIADALKRHGFQEPTLESQEAFFVRRAGDFIARLTARDARRFSRPKLALMQLLHPAHLGQKFQVLHALRD